MIRDVHRLWTATRAWLAPLALAAALCSPAAAQRPPLATPPASQPATATVAEDPEPEPDEDRFVVIRAGKILPVSGKPITDGVIVINHGKIQTVGKDIDYPLNAVVIDARDRVVMPGLINPFTYTGLPGYNRTGVRSNLRAADELRRTDSTFDDVLDAGYTTLAIAPRGNGIPGRATIVHTAGPEAGQTLEADSYLVITADKATLRGALDRAKKEIEKVEKAKKEFEEKQKKAEEERKKAEEAAKNKPAEGQPASQPASQPTSQPAFEPPAIDPAHQLIVDWLQKKDGVWALLRANDASDILHFEQVLEDKELRYQYMLSNSGQVDFPEVADVLGMPKTRLILWPLMNSTPWSAERLDLIRELSRAGCEVSVTPLGDSAREHRLVLQRLAMLVREGWSAEDALKTVTLHPARFLGIDDRCGTIEEGKLADLIILDGDPLDPSSRVRQVIIGGELIHTVEAPQ